MAASNPSIRRWREDPVCFVREVLCDPETGQPFELYPEQKTFLEHAFRRTPDGRMRYSEQCFSAGKKSGKTTLAALVGLYTAAALAGNRGEIYTLANDMEQSTSRVFKACVQILEASPRLRDSVRLTANEITFKATGTTIKALANDYAGFSGSNPTLNIYDESAYYTSEGSRRLWDEGVPSPARKISFRLSVSTAGFEGEPSPLRQIYDRAMEQGEVIAPDLYRDGNLLCYWTHRLCAPWQRGAWRDEMQRSLRPAQFARLILNQWTSSTDTFIPIEMWDAITDPALSPLLMKSGLPIWAGLDLGLRHDSSALISVAWDDGHLRLVEHKIFVPAPGTTLDIESTSEAAVLSLRNRFALIEVRMDPWQGIGLMQRLVRLGINVIEWPQTLPNLSLMAGNLLDVIKNRQLTAYPSDELRNAVLKTVAIESSRGYRLGKLKASDRVDPVIALAMGALAAVQAGQPAPMEYTSLYAWERRRQQRTPRRSEDEHGWLHGQLGRLSLKKSRRWASGGF